MSDPIVYIDKNHNLNLSRLHPTQQEFIKSQLLHSGIKGGYQSGKSEAAVTKVLTKQLINPIVPIAYYLPTYGLIDDMLAPKFDRLFDSLKIRYKYNKSESKIITPYGEIWMRSMDNPDRIVSYSVGYSIVDEVDVVHPNKRKDVMKRISSRNSFKKSTPNSIDFVSTPEGFAYMYEFFVKKANDKKKLFTLSTWDNKDNLGEGYIDGLMEQYDAQSLQAYLEGKFVNLTTGTVYRNFDRILNFSSRRVEENDVLHIGMDFNIQNMAAVVHVVDDYPIAVAELTGIYDTSDMARAIRERFPRHKIVVYPDASGKNRNTSGKTDIDILKQAGFTVKNLNQNPAVRDRVNKMNVSFLDNSGKRCYFVNTNTCPDYTEALEKMTYRGNEPDKTSGFDHVTDAGGYFMWQQTTKKKAGAI